MADISVIHIGIATAAVLVGLVIGWLVRARRATKEKSAISAGWQEQLEAQRAEHGRLVDQNRSLMEQVNRFQASSRDATNRARELSDALKEAFARRDELQREIKEIRGNLEAALAQRRRLQTDIASTGGDAAAMKEKDDKIFRLSRELDSWQNRLPPLIEKFRERDAEARRLQEELDEARATIESLEARLSFDQTFVQPADTPPDELDASNETIVETRLEAAEKAAADVASNGAERIDGVASGTLRDDLKLIKGVGPAIEKTLNELGIFRYSQIAAMSEYDIDRIAKRLKGFRTRIYREDWIGQARDLDEQRPSEH